MRVWVTGIGVVSALGRGAGRTMDRILAGERGVGPLTLFQLAGARSEVAAEVASLSAAEVAPAGEEEGWSRTDAMSVLAVREALAEAGLDPREWPTDLILGGSTAGGLETEGPLAALGRAPEQAAPLACLRSYPLSSTADRVHELFGFRSARTLSSACSSGANALLLAAAWILTGRAERVVAGGADGLCRMTYAGFGALGALSPEACRPFDRRRQGLTLGEGAGFVVLESERSREARGARAIVELRGAATGAEAHHITNPEASGATAARVMTAALERAGLAPADLDYVNAHGTATVLNDAMESAAIVRCLGAEAERVAVSSTKGHLGHTLAAAGAIEACVTAMAVARSMLPPTAGLEEIDPACALRHVTAARPAEIRAALSTSFGFGGTDTALVLAAPGAFGEPPARAAKRVVVTGGATAGPLGLVGLGESSWYLDTGGPLAMTRVLEPSAGLDKARARRLDHAALLVTAVAREALERARLAAPGPGTGIVVGSAYGSVDESNAFLHRLEDKGARLVSPADFPNLVQSSPAGHASIYLGLRGPVLSATDLDATSESAVATAADLLAAGEAEALVAGGVAEASVVVERSVAPSCSGIGARGPRGEGAAVVLLETEEHARARGARVVAQVAFWSSRRAGAKETLLAGAPLPSKGSIVVTARDDDRALPWLAGSPWVEVERRSVAERAGDHEAAGGFALAAAAAGVASGAFSSALVLGLALDRAYAIVLDRAPEGGA